MYYYGARYYDPKGSICLSVDPLASKFPNVSPYVYCLQNPIMLIDPDGRSATNPNDYVFNENGDFVRVEKNNKPDRLIVENSKTCQRNAYQFADPNDAPQSVNFKLVFVSASTIIKMINEQGGFEAKNGGPGTFATLSHSSFDYSYMVLPSKYKKQGAIENPLAIPGPTVLFLPQGDSYVHNQMNFGNFLWAATGFTLGWGLTGLKDAAHINSLNPRAGNKYSMQWDSDDDQLSIARGANFADRFGLRDLVEHKPSDYNKANNNAIRE